MNSREQYKQKHILSQSWKMLGWLLAVQILVAFVGRSISPLGVLIGEDLSLTKSQIGLLPAALFFGQSIVSLPAGFLVDKIGTKKMLLFVAAVLGLSYIILTFTSFFSIILLMICLGGLGYGASHPAANRGIIYWFHASDRGLAMGIKQMGITFGSALAALLLLPLASEWGWRPAVLAASIFLLVIGFLAYFSYMEPKIPSDVLRNGETSSFFKEFMNMAKHKALVLISTAAAILNGSQMILNTYIVLFAYERLKLPLVLAGVLLVVSEVGGSCGRVVWGIVSDRFFQSRRVIILIIISSIIGLVSAVVAFLPSYTSFLVMVPIIFIFGFTVSGFNAIWMNAATEIVPHEKSGIATGFTLTIGSWGVMVGPPVFGLIVDFTGTYLMGWLFITLMMLFVMSLLLYAAILLRKNVT